MLPGDPPVTVIESFSGHDGFLLEVSQVGSVVRSALGGPLAADDGSRHAARNE
jgi:hypothetical protein